MGYKNAIQYIIPHFDAFPLLTQKFADYTLWKQIIFLQSNQQHLTPDGFLKCLALNASLNKGFNSIFKTLYPKIIPAPRPLIILPSSLHPFWVSGFTAGDGSFFVIIRKSLTSSIGFQVQVGFNISLHSQDLE